MSASATATSNDKDNDASKRRKQPFLPVVTGCGQSDYPRVAYNESTYIFLQNAYRETVDPDRLSTNRPNGFRIDYEIQQHPQQGRGVFAKQDIAEDTQVWTAGQHAKFEDERKFRNFMAKLPYHLQCDVLLWAYPMGKAAYCELDDGSFINHSTKQSEINLSGNGKAKRAIKKGEQLLMNYDNFITYGTCPWFDEIRSAAWNDQTIKQNYTDTVGYNLLGAPKKADMQEVAPINATPLSSPAAHGMLRQQGLADAITVTSLAASSRDDWNVSLSAAGVVLAAALLVRCKRKALLRFPSFRKDNSKAT